MHLQGASLEKAFQMRARCRKLSEKSGQNCVWSNEEHNIKLQINLPHSNDKYKP